MTPILSLHNVDVTEFLAVLDTCEGNVYLVTSEGDRLNLRSKLCQLVGLTRLIEGGKIAEASIICENKNDESKLFRLNMFGDTGNAKVVNSENTNLNIYGFHVNFKTSKPKDSCEKSQPQLSLGLEVLKLT